MKGKYVIVLRTSPSEPAHPCRRACRAVSRGRPAAVGLAGARRHGAGLGVVRRPSAGRRPRGRRSGSKERPLRGAPTRLVPEGRDRVGRCGPASPRPCRISADAGGSWACAGAGQPCSRGAAGIGAGGLRILGGRGVVARAFIARRAGALLQPLPRARAPRRRASRRQRLVLEGRPRPWRSEEVRPTCEHASYAAGREVVHRLPRAAEASSSRGCSAPSGAGSPPRPDARAGYLPSG